jgi:hypothetical protein
VDLPGRFSEPAEGGFENRLQTSSTFLLKKMEIGIFIPGLIRQQILEEF